MLGAVGILADIFGLAGGAASILQKNFLLLTLSVVAVLLVTVSWLQRRRKWLAVGMLATGCLTIGGVITSGFDEWLAAGGNAAAAAAQNPPGAGGVASDAGPSTPATAATGTGTSPDATGSPVSGGDATQSGGEPTTDGPQPIVDETVTLPRSAAVDVDLTAQNPAANHTDGATGTYDLYHDWGPVQSDTIVATNGPNTYAYPGGNPATTYTTCKDLMATGTPYLSTTGEFCFRTSKGHIAHAAITQTRPDHAFVIHLTVFADPPQ